MSRYRVVDLVTGETLLIVEAETECEALRRYLDRCANRASVERDGPPDEVVPVAPSEAVPEWVDPETTPSAKPKRKSGKN